jgi:hypothetical protein
MEYPFLRMPDPNIKFVLYSDASISCSHNSRLIQGAEINYSIQELDCLAVVCAVRAYRENLNRVKLDSIFLNLSMLKALSSMTSMKQQRIVILKLIGA